MLGEKKKLEELIREYLSKGALMQAATAKDDQPWVCNVWYSYDEDLNFYFISSNYRRHSSEIRGNEKVACAIVHPIYKEAGGAEANRGITLEGTAEELNIIKSGKAFDNFMKRWPKAKKYVTKKDLIRNLTKVRFYKIIPKIIVLFDEENYPDDPRCEFHIS